MSLEAVLLTCVVDANKNWDVAIVDITNAFVQTVVKDEKDKALICICCPLVNIYLVVYCTQCLFIVCYGWEEWGEATPCPMFDCFIWHYGGIATFLQEVCQEFEVQGIQA